MPVGSDLQAALDALWAAEGRLTVLTGAGISTESGVPDFRSPGSPWQANKPIGYAEFMASPEARAEAWRRKFVMDDLYHGAPPARSHYALAAMARQGRLLSVVTQNIDGLHQAAGLAADTLVELHGNGTYAHCLTCGRRFELVDIRRDFERSGVAPTCACGGLVKSATISFGETIRPAVIEAATRATRSCEAFLAIGSSLVVRPAASLPRLAQQNGAVLVIVNREPTPLDPLAHVVVRADAGDFLTLLASGHENNTRPLFA